jgi:hypothetical protein
MPVGAGRDLGRAGVRRSQRAAHAAGIGQSFSTTDGADGHGWSQILVTCHSERSEESSGRSKLCRRLWILRFTQDDGLGN